VFYKMTLMMAMVAMELLMMLRMVMTVMVIPIADMTMATMEAVILQSMTSTRKPQRSHAHTSGTTTTGIDAPSPFFACLNTEEGLGDR
jgi:hypothetical protein